MRRAPWAVALVAGLLLGGCGIPDETEVVPMNRAPATGVASGDNTTPARNSRADTTDPAQFAKNFLEAAAGDYTNATERVKQFMTPGAASAFKPQADIKVVRLTEEPLVNPGQPVVVKAREVGSLSAKGVLTPSTENRQIDIKLNLEQVEDQQGLFVSKMSPSGLLLTDTALSRFYSPRPIYFWNQDGSGLVPDMRYMPTSVPAEQQPTDIVDWLTNGPSPWLAGAVVGLQDGTQRIGNVPAIADNTLQISLSSEAIDPADPNSLDRLQKQLRWSLRPDPSVTLRLTIENQVEKDYTGTDYFSSNPAYRTVAEPERFVIYNGRIARLSRSYNPSLPVPIIKPEDNRNVRMAALSTAGGRSYAALVVNERRGRTALKAGTAGSGEQATLQRTLLPSPVSRPVWATSLLGTDTSSFGLIAAGGDLWSFEADGTGLRKVEWPGRPGPVTAVAVAPDARRVALLAGGQLWVAALTAGDGVQLSFPHVVNTVLNELTAVDWSSEGFLVVAGVRPDSGRVAIMEVSIDGSAQTYRLPDQGSNRVTYLTAVPANPGRGEETSGAIAYVQGANAYDEVKPDRIQVSDLAEPVENPPKDVLPGAPFFLN